MSVKINKSSGLLIHIIFQAFLVTIVGIACFNSKASAQLKPKKNNVPNKKSASQKPEYDPVRIFNQEVYGKSHAVKALYGTEHITYTVNYLHTAPNGTTMQAQFVEEVKVTYDGASGVLKRQVSGKCVLKSPSTNADGKSVNQTTTYTLSGDDSFEVAGTPWLSIFDNRPGFVWFGLVNFDLAFFRSVRHITGYDPALDEKRFVNLDYQLQVPFVFHIRVPNHGSAPTSFSKSINTIENDPKYCFHLLPDSWFARGGRVEAPFDGTTTSGHYAVKMYQGRTPSEWKAHGTSRPEKDTFPGTLDVFWNLSTKPIKTQEKSPFPTNCPNFLAMQEEAKKLNALANSLERDDAAYGSAVADMFLRGYNSPVSNLGLNISEDQIPKLLATKASIDAARRGIVASIRNKATVRGHIAETGLTSDYTADGNYSKEVVQWFCDPDPQKISRESWTALYEAGYIDYKLYRSEFLNKWISDPPRLAKIIAVAASVLAWELIPARIALGTEIGAVTVDALEEETLLSFVKRKLLFKPFERIEDLVGFVPSKAVNKKRLAEWMAETGKPASKWIQEWADDTIVLQLTARKPFRVYRLFRDGETKMQAKWLTEENLAGLSPTEIQKKLSLPYTPTHIVEVEIRQGAEYWTGFAVDEGRQIFVLDENNVHVLEETIKPLPLPAR